VTDYQIPFYQLAVSELIDYSYEPINLSSNKTRAFMKSLEYGSGILYSLITENADIISESNCPELYCCDAEFLYDDIVAKYQSALDFYSKVGHTFVAHSRIDKDIYLNGRDFVIDENGKITFIPSSIVQIGDKVIIEIKESIGLPDRLIMLSSNGNNYEVGVIGEDVFIILSEFKYSKPEIFVKDSATDEVYKIYMIDEDIFFELTDIYTSQTEIKILDVDRNPYILEMVNGEFFFSPKE